MPKFKTSRLPAWTGRSLGELGIIIVGILLAIAVDDRWTTRQERLEETEILETMTQDVAASRTALRLTLDRLETAHRQLVVLSEGSDGRISSANDEAVTQHLYSLFDLPPITVSMSSYDEIKNSGRLRLLDSPVLRRRLADFDAQYAFALQTHRDAFQHQQLKLDPYLIENVQMSQLSTLALGEKADAGSENQTLIPLVEIRDHRNLLNNAVFQNHVAFKYYLVAYYQEQLRILQSRIDEVGLAIDARLNEIR